MEWAPVPIELVRHLVASQHGDLADLELMEVGKGWDNVMYRLGDTLAVRLPTRAVAEPLIRSEQRWMAELGPHLPLPIPTPIRVGKPDHLYPWHWSIIEWFEGSAALYEPFEDPLLAASLLGEFVAALALPAPNNAPINPYRGVALEERSAQTLEQLATFDGSVPEQVGLDVHEIETCWIDHLRTPAWVGEDRWVHGDLHPLNLIVRNGSLSAVIDFGDLTSGDPATDLFTAWTTFEGDSRQRFLDTACGGDEDMRRRGRAWALSMGIAYLANSTERNVLRPLGRRTIEAVLSEWRTNT